MTPIRQINIPGNTFKKIFEKVSEMFPDLVGKANSYIADQAKEFWMMTARTEPKNKDESTSGWGEKYASTIVSEKLEGGKGIRLFVDEEHSNYMFVELVEDGVTTWSIKNALLQGKAARRNKAQYGTVFVRVPFRWRVPGVKETAKGANFAGILPKDIYEKVKRGEKIGEKFGDYAGLVKMGGPLHSQYMTFRTVSEKSKDWFYPSKKGVGVFDKVKKKIEQMMDETIENIILGFLKDLAKEESK